MLSALKIFSISQCSQTSGFLYFDEKTSSGSPEQEILFGFPSLNLSDEKSAFDWYFIKDIRTGFQIAFFYEEGSVADVESDLWNEKRTSAGIGTRLVTGSGFVYRLDYATGKEGGSTIVIFDYPWACYSNIFKREQDADDFIFIWLFPYVFVY